MPHATKREPELPDIEQMNTLLDREHEPYTAAILRLAWQAGLLPSEISDLKWSDVNFEKKELAVNGRSVPMCDEVAQALFALEKDTEYIFTGGRATKMSRVIISRKAREALDSAGLANVRLLDLRNGCVLELLRTTPIEEVRRITGCEIVSLQQLYTRYTKETKKFDRAEKEYGFDKDLLEPALRQEKDSLDAQIILFSWTTGLELKELSEIRWKDIDLPNRIIRWANQDILMPEILADALWTRAGRQKEQYVFCSASGHELATWFCSRRAREFFIRHNMDNLSLTLIKGKYEDPSDQQLLEQIMQLASEQSLITIKGISRKYRIGITQTKVLLEDLVRQGKLRRVENGTAYTTLVSAQTNWERIMQAVDAYLLEHETLPISILSKQTGFATNYLSYYIKKAISMEILERCGNGLYRRPTK